MFIVTVGANIIVVFLRTFFKDRLRLDIDSIQEGDSSHKLDYLRSETVQMVVNVTTVSLFPVGIFLFTEYSTVAIQNREEDQVRFSRILYFQAAIQFLALICVFYTFFVPPLCCC